MVGQRRQGEFLRYSRIYQRRDRPIDRSLFCPRPLLREDLSFRLIINFAICRRNEKTAPKASVQRLLKSLWKILEISGIKWKNIPNFVTKRERRKLMITFIGEYSCKIDDKGRVVFPSPFKSLMPSEGDQRFVIKKDIFEDCLEMYTFEEWERQSEEVKSKLNFFNRAHAAFWREYMRDRAIVEPDAQARTHLHPQEAFGVNWCNERGSLLGQRLQDRDLGQGEIRGQRNLKRRILEYCRTAVS